MVTANSMSALHERARSLCTQEQLPERYLEAFDDIVIPAAEHIARRQASAAVATWFQGINGPQGSGKSTLARFLALVLEHRHGLRCAVLSLDDFYLDRPRREALARNVHPLFCTRGVPGTHDTALAASVFDALAASTADSTVALPAFNKATDNPHPQQAWPLFRGRADIVLFEGWCVGVPAQEQQDLAPPVNELERLEDSEGHWRAAVNAHLENDYRHWWAHLDGLIYLQIPDFALVETWRRLQEHKLRQRLQDAGQTLPEHLLSDEQVHRFIQHYERLTRFAMLTLPVQADMRISIDKDHGMTSLALRESDTE